MTKNQKKPTAKFLGWLNANLSLDNLRFALRSIIGIIVSVLIAELIGLQYAPSTCIVTLLGIQATKRDTLKTAAQRLISIIYTIVFALVSYSLLGADLFAFCLAVMLLALFSYLIGWNSTLSINVVVLVHLFLLKQPFSPELITNEIIRVSIGLTVALIINWRLPTKEREFKKDMANIEHTMEELLNMFAGILRGKPTDLSVPETRLQYLDECLSSGMDNAYIFANNNLSSHAKYYMRYIAMRETEAFILNNIFLYLKKTDRCDAVGEEIADYMDAIGHCIALEHPMDSVKEKHDAASFSLENTALPSDRNELRNRTLLGFIQENLEEMNLVKQQFIDSLTPAERNRYWKNPQITHE